VSQRGSHITASRSLRLRHDHIYGHICCKWVEWVKPQPSGSWQAYFAHGLLLKLDQSEEHISPTIGSETRKLSSEQLRPWKNHKTHKKRKNWSDVRLNGGYATHFRIRVKQVSALPVFYLCFSTLKMPLKELPKLMLITFTSEDYIRMLKWNKTNTQNN